MLYYYVWFHYKIFFMESLGLLLEFEHTSIGTVLINATTEPLFTIGLFASLIAEEYYSEHKKQ